MATSARTLKANSSTILAGENVMLSGAEITAQTLTLQLITVTGSTLKVQGSLDGGTTKVDLLMIPGGSATGVTSTTSAGLWRVDITGIPYVYLDCAGGTSAVGYFTTSLG